MHRILTPKVMAELAERGYVTLAPDYPYLGENKFDPYQNGYVSCTMKGIWNHMRAIDLLQSLTEVDGQRIGVIGHSLGGHNSLFLAAYDERVRCVVSCCGYGTNEEYVKKHKFTGGEGVWSVDGLSTDLPREKDEVDRVHFLMVPLDAARKIAQRVGAMPGIQWVSIVDLYSAEDPVVVAWYRDDGDAVKESKGSPPAKIRERLKDFVYQLQTKGN